MRGTARRTDDRQRMRRAAAERVGHENAYWILFVWPVIQMVAPPIGLFLLGWWVWFNVDHALIVTVFTFVGVAALVVYALSTLLTVGPRALMRKRVMGQRRHVAWHLTGVAGAVLLAGAYLIANA